MSFIDNDHRNKFVELIKKSGKWCGGRRIDGQYAAAACILSTDALYPRAVNHVSRDGIDFPAIKSSSFSEGGFYMVSAAENLFTGRGAVNLDHIGVLDSENYVALLYALQFRKNGLFVQQEREEEMEYEAE